MILLAMLVVIIGVTVFSTVVSLTLIRLLGPVSVPLAVIITLAFGWWWGGFIGNYFLKG
jgi:hypothetical protein